MTLAGAIFIDRGSSKDALRSLQKAGEDLKEKEVWGPYMYIAHGGLSLTWITCAHLRLALNLDVPRRHTYSDRDP